LKAQQLVRGLLPASQRASQLSLPQASFWPLSSLQVFWQLSLPQAFS